MKKTLVYFLLATTAFSCNPKESIESENLAVAEVITAPDNLVMRGAYQVASFLSQEGKQTEAITLLGTPLFGETPFNFISADSVILDKTFGQAIFGASAFSYELTDNTLTLITPEKRVEMSYEEVAGMKLTLENEYLTNLTLVKMKD